MKPGTNLLEKNRPRALTALEQNLNLVRDPLVPPASVELEATLRELTPAIAMTPQAPAATVMHDGQVVTL